MANQQHIVPDRFAQLQKEYPDELVAYFIFKRQDIMYQDTYYTFEGTLEMFENSIKRLKEEILEIQAESPHAWQENDLLDTPVDTYCYNHDNDNPCPYPAGQHCECQWKHFMYTTRELFLDAIEATRECKSYYGRIEIRDIS